MEKFHFTWNSSTRSTLGAMHSPPLLLMVDDKYSNHCCCYCLSMIFNLNNCHCYFLSKITMVRTRETYSTWNPSSTRPDYTVILLISFVIVGLVFVLLLLFAIVWIVIAIFLTAIVIVWIVWTRWQSPPPKQSPLHLKPHLNSPTMWTIKILFRSWASMNCYCCCLLLFEFFKQDKNLPPT